MTIINYFCDKRTKSHMVLELRTYAVITKKKKIKTYRTLSLATLYLIKIHMEK